MEMTWFFLVLSVLLTAFIVWQTINNNLMQKESVLWLLGCVVMVVMSVFPKAVDKIAAWVGVEYPPSLVFLLGILFLLLLVFRLFRQMASLGHNLDALSRKVAILEAELKKEDSRREKAS